PESLCDVNDSKKLSTKKRAKLFDALVEFDDVEFGLSVVEPAEIDRINILQATHKAMHEALAALGQAP
ncbi:MAG TPA: ribonuclease HII, partial [Verrucomicrobiales bacterium]|nr:ribonuclease HII [Verrucomicrobiales bacterium]